MDIMVNNFQVADAETANFILLSLYRTYSQQLLKDTDNKEYYIHKMRQIKHDVRYLTGNKLIIKAQKSYLPILRRKTPQVSTTQVSCCD